MKKLEEMTKEKTYISFWVEDDKYKMLEERAKRIGSTSNNFVRSWLLDTLAKEIDFKQRYIEQGELNLKLSEEIGHVRDELNALKKKDNREIVSPLFNEFHKKKLNEANKKEE